MMLMKTKVELNKLKEEVKSINQKLSELTPDELKEIADGFMLTERNPNGRDWWDWSKGMKR